VKISDIIAEMIQQMLSDADDGIAEIQRNELASRLGCVPSQINYVITSRFTPEQGYVVESRRGGGGFIRITKIKFDRSQTFMHIINSIGPRLDGISARVFVSNLLDGGFIGEETAYLMQSVLSDKVCRDVPQELRDKLRATMFKQMLAVLIKD
jgi:transcriptional regulator CtsR